MQELTIWHNPRCSKSRATLGLLEERGCEPHIVRYLEDPPSAKEIKRVLQLLGVEPRDLMRTKDSLYRELGLAKVQSASALIRAMAANPQLIERPVVISGQRAAICRPPENVLGVLD